MPAPPPQIPPRAGPLDPAVLLRAGFVTVVHRAAVASTMDEARDLAAEPKTALPAIVVADRQAAGRGRRGAGWWQAEGALAASIVIDGGLAGPPRPTWALACGVALAETLRALEPRAAALVRWPNDVEVAGRKLAGILVETAPGARVVIGIGVNTSGSAAEAPAALRQRLTTLPDIAGRDLDRATLLAAFLPRLGDLLTTLDRDPAAFICRYRPLCALEGTVVTIHVGPSRHTGLCRGIAASGGLVLDTPTGTQEFTSGSLSDPAEVFPRGGDGPWAARV